jgi:hypothetical protein
MITPILAIATPISTAAPPPPPLLCLLPTPLLLRCPLNTTAISASSRCQAYQKWCPVFAKMLTFYEWAVPEPQCQCNDERWMGNPTKETKALGT